MQILREQDFRKHIKKDTAPGYLFFGEEDYLKAHATRLLRDRICGGASMAEFNNIRINVTDYSSEKLLDALEPLPMFGEKKLIELSGFDFGSMRKEEQNTLFEVLELLAEYDYNTILISVADGAINTGRLPSRPSAIFKKLCKYMVPVNFEKCSAARLAAWAGKHFAHYGVAASDATCAKIIDYCGKDMYTLAGEIAKVCFFVLAAGRGKACEDDIYSAAIPEGDYDTFAFANALMERNRKRALSVLSLMMQRREDSVYIMSEVSRVFCDLMSVRMLANDGLSVYEIAKKLNMHNYRAQLYYAAVSEVGVSVLSRILSLCADADLAVKRSAGYTPIERLVCAL